MIGRQYSVTWEGGVPQSTVTAIVAYKETLQLQIQKRELKPDVENIFLPKQHRDMYKKYEEFYAESNRIHQKFRDVFIDQRIQHLQENEDYINNDGADSIFHNIFEDYSKDNDSLSYRRVPAGDGKAQVFGQECLFLNPNTADNVEAILRHLIQVKVQLLHILKANDLTEKPL